ncbi:MAG: SDR family oxidoreductase, partial [Mariprofundales bacterium]
IHSVAQEVIDAGGNALAIKLDVRDGAAIKSCMQQAAEHFGGIDALINNAGAICLNTLAQTSDKQLDLMLDINVRAPMLCVQACLPWLKKADNPHIINMSPKPELRPEWFAEHSPYTISKFGMGMLVTGLAVELADDGIAINGLWPRTVIATDALRMLGNQIDINHCRQPEIVADAAHVLLCRNARSCSGEFLSDETLLRSIGVSDFTQYAVSANAPLMRDLFVD